jgi:hypothetical protein
VPPSGYRMMQSTCDAARPGVLGPFTPTCLAFRRSQKRYNMFVCSPGRTPVTTHLFGYDRMPTYRNYFVSYKERRPKSLRAREYRPPRMATVVLASAHFHLYLGKHRVHQATVCDFCWHTNICRICRKFSKNALFKRRFGIISSRCTE